MTDLAKTALGSSLLVVSCDDVDGSGTAYRQLLGGDLRVRNGSVELTRTAGSHRAFFAVDDHPAATTLLRRRGMDLDEVTATRTASSVVPAVGVVAASEFSPGPDVGDIESIDHLVFNAADRDAAVALFAGSLGLDFRLEQAIHDGIHQLFFRSTQVVVEVVIGAQDQETTASLWGIAWRSRDIGETHRRLSDEGMSLSEIRVGRKPGTSVFTIREPAFGLPTLVLG
ncbi:VOC family protein [Williamsia soli]|uniref:VOC family protein n=1 Tax=Williamsia soli TaxID=364929 RepID=UPI001A9F5567|nr:VOC family protein [Williamsia soli]